MSGKGNKKQEADDIVRIYMEEKNRPYSVNDIHNNLQQEFNLGKAVVTKALEKLTIDGIIKEKTNGKQKLYYMNQSLIETVSPEVSKELDKKIEELNSSLQQALGEARNKEAKLSASKRQMTFAEIEAETAVLVKETRVLQDKIDRCKSKAQDVDPVENKKVSAEWDKYVGEWRKRKRMADTMVEAVLEGYPKTKKDLLKEVGIETDEDNDAVLPTK